MAPDNADDLIQLDGAWLRALEEALRDAEYAALIHRLANVTPPPGESMAELTPDLLRAYFSLDGRSLLHNVVRIALETVGLGQGFPQGQRILLLLGAMPTLNGFCLRTPHSGLPAVVLNHGLAAYASGAAHLTLALTLWTDGRYCSHHAPEDVLQGLAQLAVGVRDKRPAFVLDIDVLDCVGDADHGELNALHQTMTLIGQLFIVLHEFGHIVSGHLDRQDVTIASFGQDVAVFNRSQQAELAADDFAFGRLVDAYTGAGRGRLLRRDIAFGIGCLFVLMRTVEGVSPGWTVETHPPAKIRWRNIRSQLNDETAAAALDTIDYFFDWIEEARPSPDDPGDS